MNFPFKSLFTARPGLTLKAKIFILVIGLSVFTVVFIGIVFFAIISGNSDIVGGNRVIKELLGWFIIVSGITVFLSFLLAYYVSNSLSKRILDLLEGVRKLSQGMYNYRLNVNTYDEIGEVMEGFNVMAFNLERERKTLVELTYYNQYTLDSMSDGVIVVENDGKIGLLNTFVEDKLGFRKKVWIGKDFSLLAENLSIPSKIVERITKMRETEMECICKTYYGKNIWLNLSVSPLRNKDYNRIGSILLLKDIGKMKEMERAMERNMRLSLLGELTAGIAHEIKNPLADVKLSAELLKKKIRDSSNSEMIDIMLHEIRRLEEKTSDFLRFSVDRSMEKERFEPLNVISEVKELLRNRLEKAEIMFSISYRGKPEIYMNRNDFKAIVLNILLNSMDALNGKKDGKIMVKISEGKKNVSVFFYDNGAGMSGEVLQHSREPFFTTKENGTGLGLSLVQRSLIAVSGKMKIRSKDGKYTLILITIPTEDGGKHAEKE
ncbi:MAG: PAS domain-containing protein [Thermotogae bacterium]|nr:PAS domain-containing protein [Thermotogota bacterium]